MAGKTDRTQLQFLYKKALGFANTSNIFTENEETIPSTTQLSAHTLFGDDVPRAVTRTLNPVQSGTAEYVLLTASVLPGTTYDANDPGGGGNSGPGNYAGAGIGHRAPNMTNAASRGWANTGGGGGGAGGNPGTPVGDGGDGGSGIVLIAYPT